MNKLRFQTQARVPYNYILIGPGRQKQPSNVAFKALTAHEWWRLISAALIYHHWPLPALIVKGENFYDDGFLNANSIFLAREQEASLSFLIGWHRQTPSGKDFSWAITDGHILMKGKQLVRDHPFSSLEKGSCLVQDTSQLSRNAYVETNGRC